MSEPPAYTQEDVTGIDASEKKVIQDDVLETGSSSEDGAIEFIETKDLK
jgi:hypothetical protein